MLGNITLPRELAIHTHTHTHTFIYTHTHTEQNMAHMARVQKDLHANAKIQTGGAHKSTVHTHPVGFLQSFMVLS